MAGSIISRISLMIDTIKNILRKLNLNEKEIKIYLEILKLGTARSSELGKRTSIQRSTAKYTCEQLMKRNLIKRQRKNNAFIYTVEPPIRLLQNVAVQKRLLDEKKSQVNRIISDLKEIKNPDTIFPRVRFFEGKEGYRQFCEESLDCEDKEIFMACSVDHHRKVLSPDYNDKNYIPRRVKNDVYIKMVCPKTAESTKLQKKDVTQKRETRFINKTRDFTSTVMQYDDKVTFITTEDFPACIMIASSSIATMMNTLLQFIWDKGSSAK